MIKFIKSGAARILTFNSGKRSTLFPRLYGAELEAVVKFWTSAYDGRGHFNKDLYLQVVQAKHSSFQDSYYQTYQTQNKK
jgi:hypothetical protein